MEIADYEYFLKKEKNTPCLVAGNAPSLKNFPYERFKGKYFLVNAGPILLQNKAYPNYWLSANFIDPVPHIHYKKINLFKNCTYIFSDTASYCARHNYDYELIAKRLQVDWFAFDERHLGRKKCNPVLPCCKLIDMHPGRVTIYEYLQGYFGLTDICPAPSTSVIFSLMFAVLMGCSPIYLQGIELPVLAKDYLHYKIFHPESIRATYWALRAQFRGLLRGEPEKSGFVGDDYNKTLLAFEYIVNLCHKIGLEIYNLSPTSALNQIKNLPYLNYRRVG